MLWCQDGIFPKSGCLEAAFVSGSATGAFPPQQHPKVPAFSPVCVAAQSFFIFVAGAFCSAGAH